MDDAIDLRAYAEVLWRGRHVVAAVTLAAALLAFIVSRLFLTPTYEASALLVVESQRMMPAQEVPQPSQFFVSLDAKGYQEIVGSPAFGKIVQQKVGGDLSEAEGYRITARVVPQTSLLELTAEAPRPDQAARVANEAVSLLLQEADRLNRSRLEGALALLQGQIAQARDNLDQALKRMEAFTRRGPTVEDRQSELSAKLALLAEYQKRLTQLGVILATETTTQRELQAQLAKEPPRLTLKKALSPEATALTQAVQGLGLSVGEPVMSLDDEQLNPVHVNLRGQLAAQAVHVVALRAEQSEVQSVLDRLSREVQDLTSELVSLQAEQRELTWQVDTARRTYETLAVQYETQKAMLAARFGESALTLVREAPVPEHPTRPRPLLNAAVAGFLGLMASIVGVFFAEFWRQPAAAQAARASGVPAPGA